MMRIDRNFGKNQQAINNAFVAVQNKYSANKIVLKKIIENTDYCFLLQFELDNNRTIFYNKHPLPNGPIETSIYGQNQR